MKHQALAGLATLSVAGFAAADQVAQPASVAPAALEYDSYYAKPSGVLPSTDPAPPTPSASGEPATIAAHPAASPIGACGCEEPSCGAADALCGDACGCGSALTGGCCLGEAFTLKGAIDPCNRLGVDFGGWTQIGFHTNEVPLSNGRNDGLSFNDSPDRLNLHQQWLWAEKVADGSCGLDWGFRVDYLYGIDSGDTQSFGNPGGEFDNNDAWDRGAGYGFAMPQLYGELAYGDWSVIAGHFFTLVGYEVVQAPDNFFYSHALTQFNSEPFTHTGVLATYSGFDNFEVYGGWTLGWDTGFAQANSGSSWLGGFSTNLTDDIAFTYISTAGSFGLRSNGEDGYSHSLVFDVALSDNLNYVLQSDVVGIDDGNGTVTSNDQVGINQYLLYTINDCWAAGARIEWWKSDGSSFQEMTYGLNYRPHANLVIRPEVRYDWTSSDAGAQAINGTTPFASTEDYNRWTFGMDAILTY